MASVPAPETAQPTEQSVAPAAAPVATSPLRMPSVTAYALPVDALAEVANSSGLNWVNSDAGKIEAAQAALAALPRPVHIPRERPAPVVLDDSPLVLVETRRDLRTMTLPFEKATTA